MDRRDFLRTAGLGVAALSFAGMVGALSRNTAAAATEDLPLSRVATDVLVIGGGYAGVFAAVEARASGLSVTLVDKGTVGRSGMTPWANGFNVFDESQGDNKTTILSTVASACEYVNNPDWLEMQFSDSKARWDDLVSWGIQDKSLRHPHLVLRDKLVETGVQLVERTMLTELLTSKGAVVGAIGFSLDAEKTVAVIAKATVLCAGAGSFKAAGFPIQSLTNDGDAMAYRAGATISGKEFVDFHGTSATAPADCWSQWSRMWESGVSATHGATGGGMVLTSAFSAHKGEKTSTGMPSGPPGGSESSSTAGAMANPAGGPPPGGAPSGGPGGAPGGAPGGGTSEQVLGAATGLGIHKAEGVWPADLSGSSGVPGLWAAGDALASMLCGATYGGVGLSSSGSAVQGARAGKSAAVFAAKQSAPTLSDDALAAAREVVLAPRTRESGFSPSWVTQLLQNTMLPYYVLYVKKQDRLEAALSQIMYLQEHMVPLLVASDTHELRLAHETKSMLLNAEMKLRASMFRAESRGTHYREDHPARDDKNWLAWVLIARGDDGAMALRKQAIPEKWHPDQTVSYAKRYTQRFPGELAYLGLD
jgi:succinate dehydrogenase/fumarate reductase flavoprotein subunit